MPVDSFKYLPRLISAIYETTNRQPELPIPWTPLARPLTQAKFGLVTSGGLYRRGMQPPFDLEGEKARPTWGDPSFRAIPVDIPQEEVGASHLHINTRWVEEDINVLLPVKRFQELSKRGVIGGLAETAYSFMGFQGYPADTSTWQKDTGPQVAALLKSAGVECVLLTPS